MTPSATCRPPRWLPLALAAALSACVAAPGSRLSLEPQKPARGGSPAPTTTPGDLRATPNGTPPAERPAAQASQRPLPAAGLTLTGRVVSPDGKPAAGARVTVYRADARLIGIDGGSLIGIDGGSLVSDRGSGLIGIDGGSVVANRASGLRAAATLAGPRRALLQAEQPTGVTDATGRFRVQLPDAEGRYNVEAVGASGLKALQMDVATAREVSLALERPGTVSGMVAPPPGSGVTDLLGVEVFIPGTSYSAKAASDGSFTITGVPAGMLPLLAERQGVGLASTVVDVPAGGTVTPPTLTLQASRPTITGVSAPVAAAGSRLVVRGTGFGAARGETFSVTIGGVPVSNPVREGDAITCVVPDRGGNEGVVVTVGGVASLPASFRRVATLRVTAAGPQVGVQSVARLWLEALDPQGQPLPTPEVTWRAEGSAVSVDSSGLVRGLAVGYGKVLATTGNVTGSVELEVPGEYAEPTTYLAEADDGYVAAIGQLVLRLDGTRERGVLDLRGTIDLAGDASLPGLVSDGQGGWLTGDRERLVRLGPDQQLSGFAGSSASRATQDGRGPAAGFGVIWDLRRDDQGTVYVLQYIQVANGKDWSVRKVTPDATVTTIQLPDLAEPGGEPLSYQQLAIGPGAAPRLHVFGDRQREASGDDAYENRLWTLQPDGTTWQHHPVDLAPHQNLWPQDLAINDRGTALVLIGRRLHRVAADGKLAEVADPALKDFPALAMTRTRAGSLALLSTDMRRVITVPMPE
ncbi:MAG: IPT/TIG domain-containing protein [Candidatus Sericytochromatia bacterium]|nr:IPT/TIG domain-containing protein [Candidatus Sericytochromatia bacterium]